MTLEIMLLSLEGIAAIVGVAAGIRWVEIRQTVPNPRYGRFTKKVAVWCLLVAFIGCLMAGIGASVRIAVVAEVGLLAMVSSMSAFFVAATRLQSRR